MQRYILEKTLAKTSTGEILLCHDKQTMQQVVIKRFQDAADGKEQESIAFELLVNRILHKQHGHGHIINWIQEFYDI